LVQSISSLDGHFQINRLLATINKASSAIKITQTPRAQVELKSIALSKLRNHRSTKKRNTDAGSS